MSRPTVYRPEIFASEALRSSPCVSPPPTDGTMGHGRLVHVARGFISPPLAEDIGSGSATCTVVDADRALAGRFELFYDDCHPIEVGLAVPAEALVAGGVPAEG